MIAALVRSVVVEVGLEGRENLIGVAAIEYQDVVGALLAGRTHEPLASGSQFGDVGGIFLTSML